MALDFNGTSDVIGMAIDASLRPSLPVSIGAWIRPDTIKSSGVYTNNKTDAITNRGISLFLNGSSGDVACEFDSNGAAGPTTRRTKVGAAGVTSGTWQYLSCSIRGATDMDLYRNGTDVGGTYSGSGGALAYNSGVAGRIGSITGGNFFDGRIAEVAVWTVSLLAAEHLALAKGVSALKIRTDKLIQYLPLWTMDAVDISPLHLNPGSVTVTAVADHAPVGSPFPVAA